MLEEIFKIINPFMWSLVISIVAIFAYFILRTKKIVLGLGITILLLETTGITLRSIIGGRAPVTNMYETVLFCGYSSLFIMIFYYLKKRDNILLLSGLVLNTLILTMVNFATNMLSPEIRPLMPVLRSNFWLSIHVTTIVIAYAGLAISWILANICMIKSISCNSSFAKNYVDNIYSTMKIGVIFLVIGIVTGAIWADYSWGRFWGWDPKETWALIVLLIYMAILHKKINKNNFILVSSLAFLSVMMAWFGVNYILASGLHSYGFSSGGALFLLVFLILQLAISCVFYLLVARNKIDLKQS